MRLALVAALLTLQAPRTIWDGVYSPPQARRGEDLYGQRCATCHSPDLSGLDQAPPLAGRDFNADWDTLTLNDLADRVRVTMPADKPGSLSRQDVADLIAFLLSRGDFPSSDRDLAPDAETLKAIRFVAVKPR